MDLSPGGTPTQAALAIAATWLACCLALALALPQPPDPLQLGLGALIAAALTPIGFAATLRCRPLARRSGARRARLAVLSLASGCGLGVALLALLVPFAGAVPALHARFEGRLGEPLWRPWALGLESSILEEVAFRLLALGVIAWLSTRFTSRRGVIFGVALGVSSVLFGLAHFPAWISAAGPAAVLLTLVLLLNGVAGILFGWLFWRWGLPYAILAHFAGDVVIQTFAPRLVG